MAGHTHTNGASGVSSYPYCYSIGGYTLVYNDGDPIALTVLYTPYYTSGVGVTVSINGNGGNAPANVMQPTSFWNIMIKL